MPNFSRTFDIVTDRTIWFLGVFFKYGEYFYSAYDRCTAADERSESGQNRTLINE